MKEEDHVGCEQEAKRLSAAMDALRAELVAMTTSRDGAHDAEMQARDEAKRLSESERGFRNQLREAQAQVSTLEAKLKSWERAARLSLGQDPPKPLITFMGHCAGCHGWHPHADDTDCVVGVALKAKATDAA